VLPTSDAATQLVVNTKDLTDAKVPLVDQRAILAHAVRTVIMI